MTQLAPLPLKQTATLSPALQLETISLGYAPDAPPVVSAVTVDLAPGELLGVLGPSGCGKTSLLRLIAGFECPQSGTITIAGRRVAGRNRWVPPEQRSVGMVFQDYALYPHLTVQENIEFGLRSPSAKLMRGRNLHRTTEMLTLVGLEEFKYRYPHELSGGQQQRVALARALAPRPHLLLLDEPLSSLDVQVRLKLREEIRELLKQTGTTAIFVTHDQQDALAIADRVAVMNQGQLEQVDTPEAIYSNPISRFVAAFVAQANFLPAKRQGRFWKTEIGQFGIDVLATSLCGTAQSETGDLMIREEELQLQPNPDASVVIRSRRFLGREYRYCVETPSGKQLYARTSTTLALSVGTRVQLVITSQCLRIFPS
jgi:iron(III) transport system ATP-binding protein